MAVKRQVFAQPVSFGVRRPDPESTAAGQLAQGLAAFEPALMAIAKRKNQEAFNLGVASRLSTEDVEKAVAAGKIKPWETPHFERGFMQESGRQQALKARNAALEEYANAFDPEKDDMGALMDKHFNVRGVRDQDFLSGYQRIVQATQAEMLGKYNEDRVAITQNKTNAMIMTTMSSAVQTALTNGRSLTGAEINALQQDLRTKFPGYLTNARFNALLVEAVTQTGEASASVVPYAALREKLGDGKVPSLVDHPQFTDKIVSSEIAALNRSIQIMNQEYTLSERARGLASRKLQAEIIRRAQLGQDVGSLMRMGQEYDLVDEAFLRTVRTVEKDEKIIEDHNVRAQLYHDIYAGGITRRDIWDARADGKIDTDTMKDLLSIHDRLSDPSNGDLAKFLRDPAVTAEIDQFKKRFERSMIGAFTSADNARRSNAVRDLYRRITDEAGGSLAKVRSIVDEETQRWFPKDSPESLPQRPLLYDELAKSNAEKGAAAPTLEEVVQRTVDAIQKGDPRLTGRRGRRELEYLQRLLQWQRERGEVVILNPEEDRL